MLSEEEKWLAAGKLQAPAMNDAWLDANSDSRRISMLELVEMRVAADERDNLRAERDFARLMLQSMVEQSIALRGEIAELTERLRERDAITTRNDEEVRLEVSQADAQAQDSRSRALMWAANACGSDTALDHRLGTQQPDGEPCEPMSAKPWRWMP